MPRGEPPLSQEQGSLYVRLGQAIEAHRKARGMSQGDLGAAIGRSQRQASAYETAESQPPLHVVAAIEDALQLRRGTLLIDADAVVLDSVGTETAIKRDRSIDDDHRRVLLDFYRLAVGRSGTAVHDPVDRLPGERAASGTADSRIEERIAEVEAMARGEVPGRRLTREQADVVIDFLRSQVEDQPDIAKPAG